MNVTQVQMQTLQFEDEGQDLAEYASRRLSRRCMISATNSATTTQESARSSSRRLQVLRSSGHFSLDVPDRVATSAQFRQRESTRKTRLGSGERIEMTGGAWKAAEGMRGPLLDRLWQEESGADMIEYALIGTLIALAAIASIQGVGTKIASYYNNITSSM